MRRQQTTIPEDRVYSLISALNVHMPVEYGEGLDRAFYRLQAKILTLTKDRRFFLWQSSSSSPYHSMVARDFEAFDTIPWYIPHRMYHSDSTFFDSTISFASNGVTRIIVVPTSISITGIRADRKASELAIKFKLCRCLVEPSSWGRISKSRLHGARGV